MFEQRVLAWPCALGQAPSGQSPSAPGQGPPAPPSSAVSQMTCAGGESLPKVEHHE